MPRVRFNPCEFLNDALNGKRTATFTEDMVSQIRECRSSTFFHNSKTSNVTQCFFESQHLLFICILASELENVWFAMSYFAHYAAIQISQMQTLYLHSEFFKMGMEMGADKKFSIKR